MDPSRHRILFELGRGGMGTVQLAVTIGPAGFHKLKVLKQLLPALAADAELLRMFLDEARLAARLNHPNIVQTNEVGFDGVHHFIEMEYLEGQTLDAILKRAAKQGGMPLALSMWILSEALSGLHHAHGLTDESRRPLGVVHRDVSPHNVMVTYEGAAKVLDFGIAKAADASGRTETGALKGKLRYMAPEQARAYGGGMRAEVDRRVDVFGAGAVMWQLLVGRRMWEGLPDVEVLRRLDRGEIDRPSDARAGVPPALDAACTKALAAAPDARFATAAEMRAAIDEWLASTGERMGARVAGEYVAALFADHRAKVEADIETRLQAVRRSSDSGVEVSTRALPPADAGESTDPAAAPTSPRGSAPTAILTSSPGSPETLGRSRWSLGAAIGITVAAALAAATLLARSRAAPGGSAISRAPECHASVDCADGGTARVCRDSACVTLESADCNVVASPGEVQDDRTLWIGTMFPTSGREGDLYGRRVARATELARLDFQTISHGIPSHRAGDPARPIALVACDDTTDPARVARHLADEVRVPAVVGFHSSREIVDLAGGVFLQRQTMAIATINQSDLVTTVPHAPDLPRLVWRTSFSTSQSAAAVAAVVEQVVEPQVRAQRIVRAGQPIRVAFLRPGGAVGVSYADALFRALRFNGKSALDNGTAFRELDYGDLTGREARANPDEVVRELLAIRPHVVIAQGDGLVRAVLAPVEAQWPADAKFRPRYVLGGNVGGATIAELVGRDDDRRRRLVGVGLPTATVASTRFAMHFNETFHDDVEAADAPNATYDAIYLLAYAAYAAGDAAPSGADLARAMARLRSPGTPVEVGPAKILEAFSALERGDNVVLDGASRRLDFDAATGEASADFVVLCAKRTSGGGVDSVESGMVYRASPRKLEGTFRCD